MFRTCPFVQVRLFPFAGGALRGASRPCRHDQSNRCRSHYGRFERLGLALARQLAKRKHPLVLNARGAEALERVTTELSAQTDVLAVAGDMTEVAEEIAAHAIARFGRVDVLINNASELGPSPMPRLEQHDWESLLRIYRVNVVAPLT